MKDRANIYIIWYQSARLITARFGPVEDPSAGLYGFVGLFLLGLFGGRGRVGTFVAARRGWRRAVPEDGSVLREFERRASRVEQDSVRSLAWSDNRKKIGMGFARRLRRQDRVQVISVLV